MHCRALIKAKMFFLHRHYIVWFRLVVLWPLLEWELAQDLTYLLLLTGIIIPNLVIVFQKYLDKFSIFQDKFSTFQNEIPNYSNLIGIQD